MFLDMNRYLLTLPYCLVWPQLLSTADEVEKLQEELETMQPLLAQAAEETVETMEKIKVDSVRKNLSSISCCDQFEFIN